LISFGFGFLERLKNTQATRLKIVGAMSEALTVRIDSLWSCGE